MAVNTATTESAAWMQMTRKMKINDAKAYVADKLGIDLMDLTNEEIMRDIRKEEQKHLEVALKKADLKSRHKTMVGGAPATSRWARRIGADAFAETASEAVRLAKELSPAA